MRSNAAWAVVFALALVSSARNAGAQDATQTAAAQAIFEEGVDLLDKKQYGAACPKLEEAARLNPQGLGIKIRIAECYEGAGRLASAWLAYTQIQIAAHEAQQQPNRSADKKKQDVERERKAAASVVALSARLSKLTIIGPSEPPPGLEIRRDGFIVGPGQWGVPLPIDGGNHTIIATARGKGDWSTIVAVPNEQGSIMARVPKLRERGDAASAPETARGGAPVWSWVAGGVGLVSLGVGFGLLVASIEGQHDITEHCSHNPPLPGYDTNDCLAKQSSNDTKQVLTGVFGGAGALAIGVAAITIFRAPPRVSTRSASRSLRLTPWLGGSLAGGSLRGDF